MKLFEKNAAELSAMLQNKECSAVELTKDVLDRIDAKESAVGAYVTRCEDCLEQAEAVDNARAAGEELHRHQGQHFHKGHPHDLFLQNAGKLCSSL